MAKKARVADSPPEEFMTRAEYESDWRDERPSREWAALRKAIEKGESTDSMRLSLSLTKRQVELARLCVAEHERLKDELAKTEAAASDLDALQAQVSMLRRCRPQSLGEAAEYGAKLAEAEAAVQAAKTAAGRVGVLKNWIGGAQNTAPEVFGLHDDEAEKAKKLGGYRSPEIGNWLRENMPEFDGDWLTDDKQDEPQRRLKISTLSGLRQ